MPGDDLPPQTRRVDVGEWHEAVRSARDEGYAFFDWLSAVDESDAVVGTGTGAEDGSGTDAAARDDAGEAGLLPGVDVLCHLLRVRAPGPGGLGRLLLRTRVPEGGALRSVTDLFPGAAWHERETHEMFGVTLEGFDDGTGLGLRPLLLPEGFEGTPLRKDFVLAARASKPWPGAKEPGEGPEGPAPRGRRPRRRLLPPGVPDPSWGPRRD
ncbi:NADH-quinone oxidoreductase subunit C [uncultured Serinicoccus sp.]|uniref:NADH-quinone oxidoreductase subunit C n=1 Tax=uncultured Serinicoccus sp. TaxID=735514 RepID=UPI00260AD738|nr:NADH-quinone oxidoreductase subunit C [uncultured Serinicoccus sp.]